jgi:hypothetical protein
MIDYKNKYKRTGYDEFKNRRFERRYYRDLNKYTSMV